MARKSILDKDRFTFRLYTRALPTGNIFYARFFEKGNTSVLADRSTGEADENMANIVMPQLISLLRKRHSEIARFIYLNNGCDILNGISLKIKLLMF